MHTQSVRRKRSHFKHIGDNSKNTKTSSQLLSFSLNLSIRSVFEASELSQVLVLEKSKKSHACAGAAVSIIATMTIERIIVRVSKICQVKSMARDRWYKTTFQHRPTTAVMKTLHIFALFRQYFEGNSSSLTSLNKINLVGQAFCLFLFFLDINFM